MIAATAVSRIIYGGDRTIKTSFVAKALLENDNKAKQILDRDDLLRKAPSWRYEREWRLIGNTGLQYSFLKLIEVTFGLHCSVALKRAFVKGLESREESVKFFQMYELSDRFAMKRKYIDVDELQYYFLGARGLLKKCSENF